MAGSAAGTEAGDEVDGVGVLGDDVKHPVRPARPVPPDGDRVAPADQGPQPARGGACFSAVGGRRPVRPAGRTIMPSQKSSSNPARALAGEKPRSAQNVQPAGRPGRRGTGPAGAGRPAEPTARPAVRRRRPGRRSGRPSRLHQFVCQLAQDSVASILLPVIGRLGQEVPQDLADGPQVTVAQNTVSGPATRSATAAYLAVRCVCSRGKALL